MIITLCGSTKFKEQWDQMNKELTLKGHIILSCGEFGHCEPISTTPIVTKMLRDLHFRKIDLSDAIFVINKDGYIGKSTRNEIKYAIEKGKQVIYMEAIK